MELRFQAGGPESWSADAVIVFLSEDEKLEKAYPELLDAAPWMSIAPGMRDFHGKKGEMGLLYGPPAHPLSRAVVVGLGKLDALTYAETLEELRKGAGAAAVRCRELGVDTLALPVSGLARFNADVERTIEEIVAGWPSCSATPTCRTSPALPPGAARPMPKPSSSHATSPTPRPTASRRKTWRKKPASSPDATT